MRVDYHAHVVAHGEHEYSRERVERYIDQAYTMGIAEIGFCEHDEFQHMVDLELFRSIQSQKSHGIEIRLGLELDYFPGREEQLKQTILSADFDFVIGSVHFIEGWGFDHPDFRDGFSQRETDDVYSQYAAILLRMSQWAGIDVVGHLDLVKIWGHRPRRLKALHYFEPVLKAVQRAGIAVEINSAGLRKDVQEIYPAGDIIQRMFDYDIPITVGSDAHQPEQVGSGLEAAYRAARQAGYHYLVRFKRHQQLVTPLDY
ncbi:MAG: histidinol-phosphatase [Syntrophomonadaceae bacterium]